MLLILYCPYIHEDSIQSRSCLFPTMSFSQEAIFERKSFMRPEMNLREFMAIVVTGGALGAVAMTLPGLAFAVAQSTQESQLYIGWGGADITPSKAVNLVGQGHKRISTSVKDPITATVLALETRGENGQKEQAIMISCDLCMTRKVTQEKLQNAISKKLDDFDASKLFLNVTHTHTAPSTLDNAFNGLYDVSEDEGVMNASEYAEFFLERVSEAVVKAWNSRKPGGFSWGLGHAAVGHNRRAVYFDGSAQMYGSTNREDFDCIEGYEDHGVGMLFFWDEQKKLSGMTINVACPSQETETENYISADFWHEVREEIRKRYSEDVFIFPQCGAAGDQSPHLLYQEQADAAMQKRKGTSRRQEIALRIANAVSNEFPYAQKDIKTKTVFKHIVAKVDLPTKEPPAPPFYQTDSVKPAEFHVIRLGDTAIATNPFELYLDYGIRMKARSKATLTFLVQLSCQHSGYLPTEKAIKGGGYSAEKYIVGPEGGKVLVDETVKRINSMWD